MYIALKTVKAQLALVRIYKTSTVFRKKKAEYLFEHPVNLQIKMTPKKKNYKISISVAILYNEKRQGFFYTHMGTVICVITLFRTLQKKSLIMRSVDDFHLIKNKSFSLICEFPTNPV